MAVSVHNQSHKLKAIKTLPWISTLLLLLFLLLLLWHSTNKGKNYGCGILRAILCAHLLFHYCDALNATHTVFELFCSVAFSCALSRLNLYTPTTEYSLALCRVQG